MSGCARTKKKLIETNARLREGKNAKEGFLIKSAAKVVINEELRRKRE